MREASRRRSIGTALREVALDLVAVAGVVCVLAVTAGVVLDVNLMMFRTGSMGPEIPAGALAVVRKVPAASVSPGDVVTVERPDALPVTHRVVTASPRGGRTELVLKGDANPSADPEPYVVEDVRLLVASAPSLGGVLARLRFPPVMLAVTLAVAALVTWALWPAGRRRSEHRTT